MDPNETPQADAKDQPSTDVVPADNNQFTAIEKITPDNVERLAREADALVTFYNMIRKIALKATSPADWIMHGDTPYLQDNGIAKVCPIIGCSIRNIKMSNESRKDETGRVDIYYRAQGEIFFNGNTYTNVGMSSTRDRFFAERERLVPDPENDGQQIKQKYLLGIDEIKLPDVQKKAVTNLKHRLLMDAFRLAPTKEELQTHFGERFKEVKGFGYGKGSQGGSTDDPELKDKKTKLRNLLLEWSAGDEAAAKKKLIELTKFNTFPGYSTVERVSQKMIDKTIEAAEKLFKE